MCITFYAKKTRFRILEDGRGRQYGWKVFRVISDGGYAGEFCGINTPRPKGKWLKSVDFTPISKSVDMPSAMDIYSYEPGWHVFRTRADARRWRADGKRTVKVLVRKVREQGYVGTGEECFVADEIFIPN